LLNVKIGKFIWSDGTTYEGEWRDDKKNGQGKKSEFHWIIWIYSKIVRYFKRKVDLQWWDQIWGRVLRWQEAWQRQENYFYCNIFIDSKIVQYFIRKVFLEWWGQLWRRMEKWQQEWSRYEYEFLLILSLLNSLLGK